MSAWGHDFRPDYKGLRVFKLRYPGLPVMALTATATPRVQHDVRQQLSIPDCIIFRSSFNRPNLRCERSPSKERNTGNERQCAQQPLTKTKGADRFQIYVYAIDHG